MATLISIYNAQGLVGRCDARCYDAREPECDCVCGGQNHGRGFRQAQENTRTLAPTWIPAYTRRKRIQNAQVVLGEQVEQDLFATMDDPRDPRNPVPQVSSDE